MLFVLLGCGSLSMKALTVPNQLILGQSATLKCNYDLENSKLYSVKWYKDGQEFFRFMPSMENKIEVFQVTGVRIDVSQNSEYMEKDKGSLKTCLCLLLNSHDLIGLLGIF